MIARALTLCAISLVTAAGGASYLDVPQSAPTNVTYLASMSTRPWWNPAWMRRAPLLVSSTATAPIPGALVDCIVDFGEPVNPAEVRVVTPWETLVDCVAEKVKGAGEGEKGKVRLLFRTDLRVLENKPFLVYWGSPAAKPAAVETDLRLSADDSTVRLSNGLLDVTLDNLHLTSGLVRSIRVVGSDAKNELMERATGYATGGLSMRVCNGQPNLKWSKARIVADNAYVKSVAFDNEFATITFSLRAESRRLDYAYELRNGRNAAAFNVIWACAGGAAYDEIVYRGISGKDLATRAALDHCTDCMKEPSYAFHSYLSEGWLAIRDRSARDVVGFVFDRPSLRSFDYWGHAQAAGESCSPTFMHKIGDVPTAGAGALVALMGSYEDVRAEYLRLKDPPRIFVGKVQPKADIPVRVPRLDRDFIADYNIGPGPGAGWASGEPLEGTEWAYNLLEHIRSYGANTVRISNPGWYQLPIAKEDYDLAIQRLGKRPGHLPEWPLDDCKSKMLVTESAAAHAKGMAVNVWGSYLVNYPKLGKDAFNPEDVDLDIRLQNLLPKVGVDVVYNARAQGEGPICPEGVTRRKMDEEFFRGQDRNTEFVKKFYRESKKLNPDTPVILWNSECGEVERDMGMSEQAGFFDTCMVELMPKLWDFAACKFGAKRMRALFDNEAGRTVHHHYFFFRPDYSERVANCELPYVCGVNGFSHENLTYENFTRELSEIDGDFFRFAEYTGLGAKVAKMAPVKRLAVFRDHTLYRHDVLTGAKGGTYGSRTRGDWRVQQLAQVRNFAFDVVVNRYFTAQALAKYRAVYVPENEVFSDACAKELVAYVKAGGCAILDGEKLRRGPALKALDLQDGKVLAHGKGKIVWVKPVMPDAVWNNGWFRKLVADLCGAEDYTIGNGALDGILQSSSEGLFLGVYNTGNKAEKGLFRLNDATLRLDPASLFVLDVKNGVRVLYATNGVEIAVGAQQCGHYLIGDAAFTALPEVREGVWTGAKVFGSNPDGRQTLVNTATNFTRAVAIEIADRSGKDHQLIRRSLDARLERIQLAPDEYERESFVKALARANYLHLRGNATPWNPGKSCCDVLFKECANELKALLKRGGGILFDMTPPGECTRAFLKEVGVADPYETITKAKQDKGVWGKTVGKEHPIFDNLYQWRRFQMRRVFPKWSAEQTAPIRADYDDNLAVVVTQDKVLGAGKVVFSENMSGFTDWYENREFGDRIISWFIGRPVAEYAKDVELDNGGPGDVISK